MKNEKTLRQDSKIMETLNVSTINRIICNTDKGYLTLQIRKGENKYHLVLDAVPLLPETNKELMEILFPPAIVEMTIKPEIIERVKDKMKSDNTFMPIVNISPKKRMSRPKILVKEKV